MTDPKEQQGDIEEEETEGEERRDSVTFHGLFFFSLCLPIHDCLPDTSPDSFFAYLTAFLSS